ncbi:hypothetical protein BCL79_2005 [Stenotrophomonas rhizophila]|uniref:Uncharacterized protein n=2 Tax=Stenotrophomonas rhizophila TaxID=216778 RepID=A0A498CID7_9GAMM|nr:hypothetical protein BCL79_2005 [Stenotrophomonas rhizophila]
MEEPLVVLIARCQADGVITRSSSAEVLSETLSDLIDGVAERLRNESILREDADLPALFRRRWEALLAYATA